MPDHAKNETIDVKRKIAVIEVGQKTKPPTRLILTGAEDWLWPDIVTQAISRATVTTKLEHVVQIKVTIYDADIGMLEVFNA